MLYDYLSTTLISVHTLIQDAPNKNKIRNLKKKIRRIEVNQNNERYSGKYLE